MVNLAGIRIVEIPLGYENYKLFRNEDGTVTIVACPVAGDKPPIMYIDDHWEEVKYNG